MLLPKPKTRVEIHEGIGGEVHQTWTNNINYGVHVWALILTTISSISNIFPAKINPLTLGMFCKKCVFWTFWCFLSWISVKLALIQSKVRLQHNNFLASSIAFYHIVTRACTKIKILRKWPTSLGFFDFWNFFCLPFFSFFFLFAAVIDLLLGLLAVKKVLKF